MAIVSFRIRGKKDFVAIKIRFRIGNKVEYEISTGIEIQREDWSSKKQKIGDTVSTPYRNIVNSKLNNLKTFILDEYYKDNANGIQISRDWFKRNVYTKLGKVDNEEYNAEIYYTSFIKRHIQESKNRDNRFTGNKLSLRTIQSYETTLNKLEDYENKKEIKLKIIDINLNFHTKFINYLNNQHKLNPNTIGGYIDNLKLFCRSAELKGLETNIEVKSRDFYSPLKKTNDIYLNEDEINKIFHLDLSKSDRLSNARDWLIVGVWTGLRVSDLLKLKKSNLMGDYIHVTTFKTSTPVVIPIHNLIKKILKKRNGLFPRMISDQKFNIYIKEVCNKAKINELTQGDKISPIELNGKTLYRKVNGLFPKHDLVSSHICRRSFATNLYGKINTYSIMQITGHKTEKQFLDYIKTTSTEHAQKLKDLWSKSNG